MLVCSGTQEELRAIRCQLTSPAPYFKPFSVVCLFLIRSNYIVTARENTHWNFLFETETKPTFTQIMEPIGRMWCTLKRLNQRVIGKRVG